MQCKCCEERADIRWLRKATKNDHSSHIRNCNSDYDCTRDLFLLSALTWLRSACVNFLDLLIQWESICQLWGSRSLNCDHHLPRKHKQQKSNWIDKKVCMIPWSSGIKNHSSLLSQRIGIFHKWAHRYAWNMVLCGMDFFQTHNAIYSTTQGCAFRIDMKLCRWSNGFVF